MAQTTHPLRTKAQGKENTGKLGSKGIVKSLDRLSRRSRSKLTGYIRVGSVVLTSCVWQAGGGGAIAQIVPDETWGDEQSVVQESDINGAMVDLITQGATRGANRFHSFEQFDIGEGQSVYFDSPQGIENIFSRVTGNDASDILGTLGVNGGANLFLINPNGIIFGENASLNVNGSFVATTANGIQFGEQGFFSTTQSEPPSPLLTVNPSAFLFNQITPGRIESRSVAFAGFDLFGFPLFSLRVPDGKSLLLVGGDILIDGQQFEIDGNIFGGGLAAVEGRLELAAVAGSGTVGLTVDGNTLSLNIPPEMLGADIELTNGALVTTSSKLAEGGGDIQVWGKEITLTDFSTIISSSFGADKSGNILVNASELVQASGVGSGFFAAGEATGDGGDVMITTPVLQLRDGAQISTAAFAQGDAGNIVVNASESVQVSGSMEGFPSGLRTDAVFGEGNGGDITINTPVLVMEDGAVVSSRTFPESTGDGGDITVVASESVQLMNESRLTSQTAGEGDAGNVRIKTAQVQLDSGGIIESGTLGEGDAGDIFLQVEDSLTISGDFSGVFANTTDSSSGNGGSIIIDSKKVVVRDGGQISVESQGTGDAGNLTVIAESIYLDNGRLTAASASGRGGNIQLKVKDVLLLRGNSLISAFSGVAGKDGIDGNITIDTTFLIAIPNENSDIVATGSGRSVGSNIQVNAQRIFGTQFRQQRTPDNDIVATGTVVLNSPDIDPTQDLTPLPITFIDMSNQVDNSCSPYGRLTSGENKFIITGRGGIPASPSQPLNPEAVWEDWRFVDETEPTEPIQSSPITTNRESSLDEKPKQIIEAQGWYRDAQGNVILTADATMVTPHGTGWNSVNCLSEKP